MKRVDEEVDEQNEQEKRNEGCGDKKQEKEIKSKERRRECGTSTVMDGGWWMVDGRM